MVYKSLLPPNLHLEQWQLRVYLLRDLFQQLRVCPQVSWQQTEVQGCMQRVCL